MALATFLLFSVLAQLTAASAPSVAPQSVTAAPVTLTLRLADQRRQFRPGEVIPVELEFSSATAKRFTVDGATYDRSGRLTIDELVIDRIDDVSDPMLDYFGSIGGYIGGGIRSMGVLGERPFTVKLELNEWFRFDKPGRYTLAVKSRRVTDESVTPRAVVLVESNTVTFEILPRDATWDALQLETTRHIIDAKQPPLGARAGCRMLRFLGTDAAAMEMIRRYGAATDQGCDFDYMAGLFSAVNRAAVVQAMEDGLRAADQAVTGSYLRTLSTLSVYDRAVVLTDRGRDLLEANQHERQERSWEPRQTFYAGLRKPRTSGSTRNARHSTRWMPVGATQRQTGNGDGDSQAMKTGQTRAVSTPSSRCLTSSRHSHVTVCG